MKSRIATSILFSFALLSLASYADDFSKFESSSFNVVKEAAGKFGGKRYLIERKTSWFDLRFYPTTLGVEGAKLFGFEVVDDRHMWVPDAVEIAGGIDRFNADLPADDSRRISISVYPIGETILSRETYIEAFVQRRAIPISGRGETYFHDLGSHALQGFFIPNELVEVLRTRIQFVHELSKDLKKKFRNTSIEASVSRLALQMEENLAATIGEIDALTLSFQPPSADLQVRRAGIDWSRFEIAFAKDGDALIDKWMRPEFLSASRAVKDKAHFEAKWLALREAIYEFREHSKLDINPSYPRARLRTDVHRIALGGTNGFVETVKACANWLVGLISPQAGTHSPDDRDKWEQALSQIEFSAPFVARLRHLKAVSGQ